MWFPFFLALFTLSIAVSRSPCKKEKLPLEVGQWRSDLYHMDSAVIENKPVTLREGQVYVYENMFPNRTIKYIHVDNLAIKTCGASATIKSGGVDKSSVWIVLHAEPYNEIRSVIDIWGTKAKVPLKGIRKTFISSQERRDKVNLKSLYLFKDFGAINHNFKNDYDRLDYDPRYDQIDF